MRRLYRLVQGRAISLEGEGEERTSPDNVQKIASDCAECILTCTQGAIQVQWNESIPVFMEKMVEYASAVCSRKKAKTIFMTFVTDVSPLCDCTPFSDRQIVPNIGILASLDPVAIDQAAVDMVNGAPGNPLSVLDKALDCRVKTNFGLFSRISIGNTNWNTRNKLGWGRDSTSC